MSLLTELQVRAQNQCELCKSKNDLSDFMVAPKTEPLAENAILICQNCNTLLSTPTKNPNHWRCLSESIWSEHPAVQVLSWRLLKSLSAESWANDVLDQVYLSEETLAWAEAGLSSKENDSDTPATKDSNGNTLLDGDSVTLIKDLEVKGANFTAKRGTVVKNISLTNNPAHIEGRVNGTQIVLLTCFLKKVV